MKIFLSPRPSLPAGVYPPDPRSLIWERFPFLSLPFYAQRLIDAGLLPRDGPAPNASSPSRQPLSFSSQHATKDGNGATAAHVAEDAAAGAAVPETRTPRTSPDTRTRRRRNQPPPAVTGHADEPFSYSSSARPHPMRLLLFCTPPIPCASSSSPHNVSTQSIQLLIHAHGEADLTRDKDADGRGQRTPETRTPHARGPRRGSARRAASPETWCRLR